MIDLDIDIYIHRSRSLNNTYQFIISRPVRNDTMSYKSVKYVQR